MTYTEDAGDDEFEHVGIRTLHASNDPPGFNNERQTPGRFDQVHAARGTRVHGTAWSEAARDMCAEYPDGRLPTHPVGVRVRTQ